MGRPARMGNTCFALQSACCVVHLRDQFGYARGAAGTLQTGGLTKLRRIGIDRHAARVISTVLQALQALNQYRNHIAAGNRTDDAAHSVCPLFVFFHRPLPAGNADLLAARHRQRTRCGVFGDHRARTNGASRSDSQW